MSIKIPVIDLQAQYRALQSELDAAVQQVLQSGWYVLGQEVATFEAEFAAYCQAQHSAVPWLGAVGVNSGTDALQLALRACDVGPNDEVITVAHTAVATVAAIRLAGATPVLVDIDPTSYTIDPAAVAAALSPRTKAIIPVHLYGHPAALRPILQLAQARQIAVIEDCAQAHGARYHGQRVGTFGDLACFSFYPTKNLGAMGDGGAVVGRDPALLEKVRALREYGWQPSARYISQSEGMNSRLDEMQAALLRVKLRHLDQWNEQRRALAAHYHARLPATIRKPQPHPDCEPVYHLYVIQLPPQVDRAKLQQQLAAAGIGTAIHYPMAVHQQPAYQNEQVVHHPLPTTEEAVERILTLPLHPQLTEAEVDQVVAAVQLALNEQR